MQIFGRVVKTQLGYGVISDYRYKGYLYNEYGQLIASEIGGMTEEACREAVIRTAQRVYSQEFFTMTGFFAIEKESTDG